MARKQRIRPFEAIPYTNEIGQVIQPGDSVAVVTGSRSAHISTGRYVGHRKQHNRVIVETDHHHDVWVHKESGEEFDSKKHVPMEYPQYPRYGQGNWDAIYGEYQKKYGEWWELQKKIREEQFKKVKIPYISRRTLQLNRIFKIDTNLSSLDGQTL